MRLVDRFNPLFALAVDIHSYPVSTANKNALKEAIYNAIAKEQNAQVSNGISLDDMDLARTAVYFFIDEVLMDEELNSFSQNPEDTQESNLAWYQNSLQNTFLNTEKGGELFFIYFEQILDKILSFSSQNLEIQNNLQNMQTRNTPNMTSFLPQNIHEKFIRASQLIAGFSEDDISELNEDITLANYFSTIETLQVYAKCLLYGFRGKYYDQSYHTFLQDLRQSAYAFLQINSKDTNNVDNTMYVETPKASTLPKQLRRKTKLGYFFYIACPPLLCAMWYFYCAQTVSQILL